MDPSISQVRKLLYRHLRVKLKDGRTVSGDFLSFDKQGAIILGSTQEVVVTSTGMSENRHMGIVLIPHDCQERVELQGTLEEKMRLTAVI